MKRAYIYELLTALALLVVIEAYLWTQSRTLTFANTTTKVALIAAYLVFAIGSQAAVSSSLGLGLRDALKGNVLVAAIVSLVLTALALCTHPATLKDMPTGWVNALIGLLKFFVTIGLATMLLRMTVAIFSVRLARR